MKTELLYASNFIKKKEMVVKNIHKWILDTIKNIYKKPTNTYFLYKNKDDNKINIYSQYFIFRIIHLSYQNEIKTLLLFLIKYMKNNEIIKSISIHQTNDKNNPNIEIKVYIHHSLYNHKKKMRIEKDFWNYIKNDIYIQFSYHSQHQKNMLNRNQTSHIILSETFKSGLILHNKMIEFDNYFKNRFEKNRNKFKPVDFRYYVKDGINKDDIFKKEKSFVTSVFINESYIPAALVLGESFRIHKTKYPIICMVQDRVYETKNRQIFEGVSYHTIQNLLEIYDMVIGMDLLKIDDYEIPVIKHYSDIKHASTKDNYKNIIYYVSKYQCMYLEQFKQLFYIDASAYIGKNIDYVFRKYNGNYFYNDVFEFVNAGCGGSHCMIKPKQIYYYKLLYLCKNYHIIFKNLYFMFTPDEVVLYYSIYPHWDGKIKSQSLLSYKRWTKTHLNRPIRHFMVYKPFRPLPNSEGYKDITNDVFEEWDNIVNILLQKYPLFYKYFEHIKTFRNTKIKV